MGQRDALYLSTGTIEMDEGNFTHGSNKDKSLKRGRGSQRKKNVAVLAESTPVEEIETGKKSSQFRYSKNEDS